MAETNSVARSLHDVGLAAWFGGALMGAVGLNGASEEVADPKDRIRVADAGWGRWTPVNLLAIVAHLVGAFQLLRANKGRLVSQQGVATLSGLKTAATVGALGVTAWSRLAGQKLMDAEADAARSAPLDQGLGAEDAVTPGATTPDDVASAQRQLKVLQWLVPLFTGVILVVNARMGEQQRPLTVAAGVLSRLRPSS
jgi:hypothetical protein